MPPRSKHPSRRKGFQAIPFSTTISPSTLANGSVFLQNLLGSTFSEDFFAISIDCQWSLRNGVAGEGPIGVGYAHGDLTTTEVSEALIAELTDPDDIITREQARRPVRYAASFPSPRTTGDDIVLKNGELIRTTLKIMIGNGHELNLFCVNRSGASLNGSQVIVCEGVLYGRWVR